MVKPVERGPRSSEAGYNMVVLMVAVTLLSVFTAVALPMWSQVAQREKEEELIFRGWQYAEAIRVFQQRHGRYPTQLRELIEVKPRSIRRLWKDPMTESGEWKVVFQGASGPRVPGGDPNAPRDLADPGGSRQGRRQGDRRSGSGEQVTTGPIVGVQSRSSDDAIKILFGEGSYDGWQFTVERLTGATAGGQQVGGVPRELGGRGTAGQPAPIFPAKWIGRPFPPGLEPQGGGLPGGGQGQQVGPDGRPARRPGPGQPARRGPSRQ